jgi:DNA (cytosine-5)-methyltransferase 1
MVCSALDGLDSTSHFLGTVAHRIFTSAERSDSEEGLIDGRISSMQAIDLYSGIGGWAVGLKLAKIEVIASYERSEVANETNRRNNRHSVFNADLRSIDLETLPKNVTAVVGSPPCTQFSFSNRGGGGDLSDGLEDVLSFLRIVDHLRPHVWAMENVPRLSGILAAELVDGGKLAGFRHLGIKHAVLNMEEFGLPQKRKRCIVGNFDLDLLRSYCERIPRRTLGSVVEAFHSDPVMDPIFEYQIGHSELRDHVLEENLDAEEARINCTLKTLHPIYNAMHFPDRLDRSSRTITATCTRVSRESIVIEDPAESGSYRRLTIRERASCQGFPISFQFYGESYSEKLQMVGNAIPPLFAYYVGHAMLGTTVDALTNPVFATASFHHVRPALDCLPNRRTLRYRPDRNFQFALPSLHLKSGVRFELNNGARRGPLDWHVRFVFGTSKRIQHLRPDGRLKDTILSKLPGPHVDQIESLLDDLAALLRPMNFHHLQAVWCHQGPGETRPFMLLDTIDRAAAELQQLLKPVEDGTRVILHSVLATTGYADRAAKLMRNSGTVIAGLLTGGLANEMIQQKAPGKLGQKVQGGLLRKTA